MIKKYFIIHKHTKHQYKIYKNLNNLSRLLVIASNIQN